MRKSSAEFVELTFLLFKLENVRINKTVVIRVALKKQSEIVTKL